VLENSKKSPRGVSAKNVTLLVFNKEKKIEKKNKLIEHKIALAILIFRSSHQNNKQINSSSQSQTKHLQARMHGPHHA